MNELIFIIHALAICVFLLIALQMGKQTLITFIAVQSVFANLFVLKQIGLFTFNVTASDAYTIGGLLGLNVLQEYYGRAQTNVAIWTSFFIAIMFAIASQLHLWYIPTAADTAQQAYCAILSVTPRIVGASLITYIIVQFFDATLYGYLKRIYHKKWYILRNYISVSISQLLDTILFSFLGLYGLVENIWDIVVMSYLIKLSILLVATPFLVATRWIVKK